MHNDNHYCPYCERNPYKPDFSQHCVLNKPLLIAIPPEGIHLMCPAHPKGHHIFGSNATLGSNSQFELKTYG